MTSNTVVWTYALAPDVEVRLANGGALLRTITSETRVEAAAGEHELLELLAGNGGSEAQLQSHLTNS